MSLFRESVPDRDSYRTAHTAYSQDPDLAVPLWTLSGHSQGPKYHRLLWRGDILGACKQPYEHIVCLLEKKQQAILSLKPLLKLKEMHSPPLLMLMLSQKGCQPQLTLLLTRGKHRILQTALPPLQLGSANLWDFRLVGKVLSSCQLPLTVNIVSLRSSAMGSSGHPEEDRRMTAFSSNIPQETAGTERKWSDQNGTVLNDTLCSTKIC